MLCIDVGNTRLKWCIWQGENILHNALAEYELQQLSNLLEQWFLNIDKQDIFISSVASGEVNAAIEMWFSKTWDMQVKFITSKSQQLGVTNSYKNAQQMGVDRWLAMLAAYQRYHSAVCIIDCGTAVTLDAVDGSGRHLGGLIMPGLDVMQRSLSQSANGIQLRDGKRILFANNTPDAVTGGCFHLLVEGLNGLYLQYKKQIKTSMACVITGGNGEMIAQQMECDCQYEKDLILHGLRLVAELSE